MSKTVRSCSMFRGNLIASFATRFEYGAPRQRKFKRMPGTLFILLVAACSQPGTVSQRASTVASEQCQTCDCVSQAANVIFGTIDSPKGIDAALIGHCASTSLPSPRNTFLANNIRTYVQRAAPGGPYHRCEALWRSHLSTLRQGNATDSARAHNERKTNRDVLARMYEDQYFAAELRKTLRHASESGTSGPETTQECDKKQMIQAMNVIVRYENAAFLEQLLASERLKDLLRLDDGIIDDAVYVLTQHSEMFPDLLKRVLAIRREFFDSEGLGSPTAIAGLADRISIKESKSQLYGSHIKCVMGRAEFSPPLAHSVSTTNSRRRSLGLPTVAEHLSARTESWCKNH